MLKTINPIHQLWQYKLLWYICDTWAQNPSLVVCGFSFNHILHCICLKTHFTESKYLVSNWSYTCL